MRVKKYLIILLSILTLNVNSKENISDIIPFVIPLNIYQNYYIEFEYKNKNSEIYLFSYFKEEVNIEKPEIIKIYNNKKELIQKIRIEYELKSKKYKIIQALKIEQFKLINY